MTKHLRQPMSRDQVTLRGDVRANLCAALPEIAANVWRAEAERKVPAENVALLKRTGLTRAFLARRYGGLGMTAAEYGPCLAELAQTCGATAWSVGLLAQHSHGLSLMSERLQDEIWGEDNDALVCSSVAPAGTCAEVEGGIRISGEFRWSSGCDHAQWAFLGVRHPGDGERLPGILFAVLPRVDYEIVDDWHSAGMQGTGTKTLRVRDAFVPWHRTETLETMNAGGARAGGPDRYGAFAGAFMTYFALGFSAASLGIARRMVEVYKQRTAGRVRAYTGTSVAGSAPALARLAESAHQVEAAAAFLERDWARITQCTAIAAAGGGAPMHEEVVAWRCNQAYAVKMCVEATDRLFTGLGGSAWYADAEPQLLWRNAKATAAHAFTDYDVAAQVHSRSLMGLTPDAGLI